MLEQLTIRNFAIIDRLELSWQPGFTVITGETGAGKSIIIDAVGALLGDRLGPEVVRSGADRALVEGVFTLDQLAAQLSNVLDEYGLEPEDGALIVSREVAGSGGRGGARINGRAVPLAVLQELGEQLVDVHGQTQHMALLRPREQLEYLDRYAGLATERAEVARLVRDLRATREARHGLLAEERETARLQDMLRHEIAEIDRAELREDEEEELQAQRTRLYHVERLRQAATTAYEALMGVERETGERPGAVDLLGQAVSACHDGARFDPALGSEMDDLNAALAQAEESARTLRDYVDTIEADPQALERTEERLFLLGDLKRKYGETIRDVLAYQADAQERLDRIEHRAERLAALEAEAARLTGELAAAAQDLSRRRSAAADRLAAAVEKELTDLRLGGARFDVSLTWTDDADGVPIDGRCVAFDLSGVDRVEFLISANPGEEPRPMARVASGGELARIALALKTILSRAETRPTLIFDEVDIGVGGRTGPVVGEKLWSVGAAGHQVLCVTHMPQVAAFADHHYVVAKHTAERAETHVSTLDEHDRVEELAAMLAGTASDTARDNARELLRRAESAKRGARFEVRGSGGEPRGARFEVRGSGGEPPRTPHPTPAAEGG
jgi:DNA repair protein RecN (Recombination protein N)